MSDLRSDYETSGYVAAPAPSSPSPDSLERLIERLRNFTAPRIAGELMDEAAAELSRLRAALTEARIWIFENTEADEIAESKADELLAKIDAALGGQHGQ